jgi:hypothetical protein
MCGGLVAKTNVWQAKKFKNPIKSPYFLGVQFNAVNNKHETLEPYEWLSSIAQ